MMGLMFYFIIPSLPPSRKLNEFRSWGSMFDESNNHSFYHQQLGVCVKSLSCSSIKYLVICVMNHRGGPLTHKRRGLWKQMMMGLSCVSQSITSLMWTYTKKRCHRTRFHQNCPSIVYPVLWEFCILPRNRCSVFNGLWTWLIIPDHKYFLLRVHTLEICAAQTAWSVYGCEVRVNQQNAFNRRLNHWLLHAQVTVTFE